MGMKWTKRRKKNGLKKVVVARKNGKPSTVRASMKLGWQQSDYVKPIKTSRGTAGYRWGRRKKKST